MKISIIYDSKTGNTAKSAGFIADGMNNVSGVEARAFLYSEIDESFVKESSALIFGCPTYMANMTADFHTWLQTSLGGLNVADKLGGVFATEQYIHGGADLTMSSMISFLLVRGMMIYSGGGAHGAPCIHLGPVAVSPGTDSFRNVFEIYGKRFAERAAAISK